MEYPPMWIWAIIIGIIIGTKFVIRWQATKLVSRQDISSHDRNVNIGSGTNKNSENYNSNKKVKNIRA